MGVVNLSRRLNVSRSTVQRTWTRYKKTESFREAKVLGENVAHNHETIVLHMHRKCNYIEIEEVSLEVYGE